MKYEGKISPELRRRLRGMTEKQLFNAGKEIYADELDYRQKDPRCIPPLDEFGTVACNFYVERSGRGP